MQVFKLYFKLLKSVAPALLIYGMIFSGLTLIYAANQKQNITNFEESKIDVAVVNYNKDNILVQDFLDYLSEYCTFYEYGDNETDLSDALFYRKIQYILTIPYQFGEDLSLGKNVVVEKKTVPDAFYAASVDNAINKYLNTAKLYLNAIPGITQKELISYIRNDINTETNVIVESDRNAQKQNNFYMNYFNTSSYVIIACCILGIGMIMISLQNIHIHRRNMVAPISLRSMNFQLIAGNIIFVLGFDILLILLSILFNKDKSIDEKVLLYWFNTIIFSISALSISFLIALLVKSKGVNSAISTVVSLGLSFISGAFIPQMFLGSSVLKIASFTPVYWYIKGNNTISNLSDFQWGNIKNIFYYMAIQIGFAAALIALSLVVSKNRRQRNY